MAREDGIWLQDWTTGDNLKINTDGSLNTVDASSLLAAQDKIFQIAGTFTITGSGTENNFLLIRNPSGSGKQIRLIDITVGYTNTINVLAYFKLYSSPTVTANGTAITIKPGRIGSSVPSSSVNAYSNPTVSDRGTEYLNFMAAGGPSTDASWRFEINQSILVDPNYDILLTGTPDGTNRNVLLTVRWAEV